MYHNTNGAHMRSFSYIYLVFLLMIIEACPTPKLSIAKIAWILGPADIQGGLSIQSLHVCTQVYNTPY